MQESRLFSFIDKQSAFTLHLLEGAKLMTDICTVHNIGPVALDFYREVVLSSMHMTNFMKATENMGFYIDSEEPYFRFKVEMNSQGNMRTLLLPEEFENFPEKITGKTRLTKAFPNATPYSSIIQLNEQSSHGIVNQVLEKSYQTNTEIMIGYKDFSLMYSKLPPSNLSKKFDEVVDIPLADFIKDNEGIKEELEKIDLESGEENIIKLFTEKGFTYLGSKEIKFNCPCSKERMVANMLTLGNSDMEDVFTESNSIEVRCDYCNTVYDIHKDDLKAQ
ncbi:MAG: Hsp33 family molecular chaperone HslO [Bacteriovoracaceae bacterium]|nr:Hsp33 family molecular chaperone HslO [Bacteriovoracaceae bacterium]